MNNYHTYTGALLGKNGNFAGTMLRIGKIHISRRGRRLCANWLAITIICFVLFEMESLQVWGLKGLLMNTREMVVNLTFSAIFSLSSLWLCTFVYRDKFNHFHSQSYRRLNFVLVVVVNFAISFVLAEVYDLLFPSIGHGSLTDDIMEAGLVTALCSLVVTMWQYGEVIMRYQNERKLEQEQAEQQRQSPHFCHRMLVARGDELVPLRVSDISFVRRDATVSVYLHNGSHYNLQLSLGDVEDMLDPDRFFRLNRQYIASIDSIESIKLMTNSRLTVRLHGCDDEDITVSKERAARLREWLMR